MITKIKTFDSKHFSSNGKLKSGKEAIHNFFENQLGEVALLHKTVKEINNQLTELQEKCSQLFKGTCSKPKSRKRKQKQNKRKAKKAKNNRMEVSCKVVIKTIAPQHNADSDAEPIGPLELYCEGISTLKKKQLPYIRYAFDKVLFTVAAKDVIKQHMAFTMSETDDSDGGHDYDDEDDDGNGDNNVEDDPDGSTSDSDAVTEISSSE